MVAIFTGSGTGFERGSGSVLGSAGLLGSSTLGRSGEQLLFNAATGNLMVSQRDEFLVGLGLDASVTRTYNSLGDLSDENGDNWRQGNDRRIVNLTGTLNTAGSTVQRVSGDGSVITYSWDAIKSAYVATDGAGAYDTLTRSGNTWTWTDGDSQITETYQYEYGSTTSWRIASQADTEIPPNTLAFSYIANSNRLSRVTTQNGEYIEYEWDQTNPNRLVSLKTYAGAQVGGGTPTLTRTSYTYDGDGRLATVRVDLSPENNVLDANGNGTIEATEGYVTTYAYVGSSKRIATISQSDGSHIAITYDGSNRVATLVQTASSGVTRTTGVTYGAGYTEITDPLGLVTRLDYYAIDGDGQLDGQLKSVTLPPAVPGGSQQVILFGYNPATNDVTSVKDALGNTTTYSGFVKGLWTTKTDREGNVTTRTYGTKNELLTETTTSSDANSGAAAHTVRFAYDGENHLRYRVSAEGYVTEYRYTAPGEVGHVVEYPEHLYDVSGIASTTALSLAQLDSWVAGLANKSSTQITFNVYDPRGALVSSESYGIATSGGATSTAEGTTKIFYTYDQAGNLKFRTTQGRNTETFVYDGLNRLTAAVDINGGMTSYVFDDANTKTIVTLANGLIQTSTYNRAGELISFAESVPAAAPPASNDVSNIAPDVTNPAQWTPSNLTLSSTTIGGNPGTKLTITADDSPGCITTQVAAASGETVSIEFALQQSSNDKATIQISPGGTSGTTADIVSGPGILTLNADGSWGIRNLSRTQPTIIRVTRTLTTDATTSVAVYVGDQNEDRSGQAIIVGSPNVSRTGLTVVPLDAVTGTATYGYDPLGRMRWLVDATGNKSYFLYDQVGRKTAEISSQGDVIEYRYDANNRLIATINYGNRLTMPLPALDDEKVIADVANYRPSGPIQDLWSWNIYDKEGQLLQSIAGDGSTAILTYDGAGRLVKKRAYYNKLDAATLANFKLSPPVDVATPVAVASFDEVTRLFYDKDGRLIGTLDSEGYLGRSIYDSAGQKTDEIGYATITNSAYRSVGTFNELLTGLANTTVDRRTRYVYNGQGQLRFTVDGQGHVAETIFDGAGQPTRVIAYANALAVGTTDFTYDNIKGMVAAAGFASTSDRSTWSVYDLAGRVVYAINAEGGVTGYNYNASGQVTKAIQYNVVRSTTSLPLQSTMDSWATTNASAANDRVTRNYYDDAGVLRYVVNGEGYISRRTEDAEGRLVQLTRWSNSITVGDSATTDTVHSLAIASGGATVETSATYDTLGRMQTSIDGEGFIRRYEYDANGLLANDIAAWGTSDVVTTHFVYDGAGRVTERHDAFGAPEVSIVKYSYDGLGNVLTITDPLNKITTQTFDQIGRVLSQTDALSGSVSFVYNAFGEVIRTTDQLSRNSYNYYDNLGRLTKTSNALKYVTERIYTAFSEIASITQYFNAATNSPSTTVEPTVTADPAKDAVTQYVYDKLGRQTQQIDALNLTTQTGYTTFGEVASVTRGSAVTSIEYDRRGLVTKATDAENKYELYTLDAFGNRVSVRNKLGGIIVNTFDKRGLLISETLPMKAMRADGTTQATTVTNKFEYDARGNRTKMIEANGLTEQRTTIYEYDKLNRLTAKKLDAVTTISFNDFTSSTGVTVTTSTGVVPTESYVYDAAGRLKQVTDALGGRTVSFYDDIGRKTAEVGPLGTMTEWTYDAAGNMLTAKVYGVAVTVPVATATTPPTPISPSNCRETVYTYDNLNRLTKTSIANIWAGSWNGSNGVAPALVTLETFLDYDANGNVIKSTDANGNAVYSYYDKLGNKTGQVDAENYITTWTYDAEGNVLSETRGATKYVGTPVAGGTVPSVAADTTNDRVTNFTYDKTGHRLTETRTGVKIATVNTTNGTITESTVSSAITYTYNGLGQVLSKAEATGDTVTYTYDSTGRLTKESRASYDDYVEPDSTTVTPTVEYYYNGLNDLSRTRQGGATAVAGDRITTYAYGANGRLASMTDPAGYMHSYDYDAAGNIVRDSYTRTKSDGSTVNEGILYRRDLLGRVTVQAIATKVSATSWTRGDGQNTAYNAYGEVSGRGINGLWQESFFYDPAGRLLKTNSGDGVWRFFFYDKNSNRTLTIESEGTDFLNMSDMDVLNLARPGGVAAGAAFVDGLNVAITTYDKRGQALSTIMTQRELATGGAKTSITNSQAYNAFGEVKSQTDALGNATTFTYNTMGRLIQKVMPSVSVTSAAGVVSNVTPTEYYYYDKSGRMVASKDANGNLTSRTLLAGSGYGEAEALVTAEYHADGGIARIMYDVFGDARILRNELNVDETHTYDAMGRVTNIVRRTGLKEDFTYDLLGQRLKHTLKDTANVVLGTDTTDYDLQGRVVSTVDIAGDKTTYGYTWSGTIATALGTTGGWTKTTTQWSGTAYAKSKTETTDVHGLTTNETDFGANTTAYTFDKAGRLTQKVGTAGSVVTTLTYTFLNTGLVATVVDSTTGMTANTITSTFAYDAMGRRTAEKYAGTVYKSSGDTTYTTLSGSAQTLQDATITYDALGRLATFSSTSSTGTVTVNQYYDAAGNIRRTQTTYPNILTGGTTSTDKWFTYDAMNRMVIADGSLVSGVITGGSSLTYDVVGNRKTATKAGVTETYNYDNDNQVTTVLRGGSTIASTTRDIRGRVTEYYEYSGGTLAAHRYNIAYNARGQVSSESNFHWMDGGTDYTATVTNQYDNYGNMTRMDSVNDNGVKDTWQAWVYAWKDQAVVSTSTFDRETWDSNNNIYDSAQYYDGLGRLQRAMIDDGRDRGVHYALDAEGQVLSRVQNDGQATNDPREYHLFVSGRQIAEYTNDANEDTRNYDYAQLILSQAQPGAGGSGRFYQGTSFGTSGAETGTSGYDPLNSITAGASQSSRSRYTVQSGDTLEGIAASLWGDSSLWYLIADANGLSAGASLAAGQSLSIPLKGPSNRNNADMFRPYDTSSAVGDLSPTSAKPPKKGKCGVLGQVMLAVIQIAVTLVLAPYIGYVPAAMVANAASQGVGIATGIQQGGFSWKQMAIAGATAAIAPPNTGSIFLNAAAAAATNAAVQGISVATGLQKKFDWVGVAAAGVSAGVGSALGTSTSFQSLGRFGQAFVSSGARLIANASTRSLINGDSFGDNMLAGLSDAIAQTINGVFGPKMAMEAEASDWSGGDVPADDWSFDADALIPDQVPVDLSSIVGPGISFGVAAQPTIGVGGGQIASGSITHASHEGMVDGGEIVVRGSWESLATTPKTYISSIDLAFDRYDIEKLNTEHVAKAGHSFGNIDEIRANFDAEEARLMQLESLVDTAVDQRLIATFAAPAAIGGLAAVTVAAVPAFIAAAPEVGSFILSNALNFTRGAGVAGEIITGVSTIPVATGTGAAVLGAAERTGSRFASLSSAERRVILEGKLESNAMRRLEEMQRATPGAHFVERHGAQLSLASQYDRAAFGINPTTGAQSYATDATRFFSARDQLSAITRSEQIFQNTGSAILAREPIPFGRVIGEGYQKGTLAYGTQTQAIVRVNPLGKAYTAYPRYGY